MQNLRKILTSCTLLLGFLLVSCDAGYAPNPQLAALDGAATVQVATAIAQATAEAQRQIEREATRAAARTVESAQIIIQQIEAEIRGTDAAMSAVSTVAAGTANAESARASETAQAVGTATAWPQTATPLSATQQAVILAVEREQRRAVTQPVANAAMVIAAIIAATYVIRMFLEVIDRRYRLLETRSGTVAFYADEYGKFQPQLLEVNPRKIISARATDAPVVRTSAGGITSSSPMPTAQDGARRTVLELVQEAIDVAGEEANQFPSWRRLPSFTSEKYQRAMRLMKDSGLVKSLPSVGTFVVGDGSLGDLMYQLEMRQAQTC